MNESKFKIIYDDQPDGVVGKVSVALAAYGLTIDYDGEGGDGFVDYKIIPITETTLKPDYEYEMFFKSESTDGIKIDGWIPIAINSIRHPEKIDEYLEKGILRKFSKQ